MSVEKAFVVKLKAALLATSADGPHPGMIPPNLDLESRPAVAYSGKDEQQAGRTIGQRGGLPRRVFQVDAFCADPSNGYQKVKAVEDAIRDTFDPNTEDGARGNWTYSGGSIFVQHSRVEQNSDDFAPPAFARETGIHAVSLNVVVFYEK